MALGDVFAIVVAPVLIAAATGYMAKSNHQEDMKIGIGLS